MPKYQTIAQMEQAAALEEDGSVSTRIRGQYLVVTHTLRDTTEYQWGRNAVTRAVANNVLASQ